MSTGDISYGWFIFYSMYVNLNTARFALSTVTLWSDSVFRIYGNLTSTYESASTRRFQEGRVDNIRAATVEALEFARSMVGDRVATVGNLSDGGNFLWDLRVVRLMSPFHLKGIEINMRAII